jgi:type VI secretion system protein ImpF
MAAPSFRQEVRPSLLDRLIDLDPESEREVPTSPWEEIRDLRAALCRDLTALLNTRRATDDFDRSYEESANSLLSFGITDFTSYNLKKSPEQEQLRKSIERSIRQFEPRLERIEVTLEQTEARRPILRFQVSAVLRNETREPVVFDATLHRDSRRIAVSGEA